MNENQPLGESVGSPEVVRVFAFGTYPDDDFGWGWQCFACRDEQADFISASGARDAADSHEQTCRLIDPWLEQQATPTTMQAALSTARAALHETATTRSKS